jgi:hypothetical protein
VSASSHHQEYSLINLADHARGSQPKPPLTLQSVQDDAIKQLQDAGRLSATDYKRIDGTTLEGLLASVDNTVARNTNAIGVFRSLLERLGKFEKAIDMLVQSSPQVLGLSLVGLIWGSLKVFLVVSHYVLLHLSFRGLNEVQIERDIANTFAAVVALLDGVLRGLPALDIYIQIFGASHIRLLEKPLVDLYATLITFGIEAAKLFDRPVGRKSFVVPTETCLSIE